MTEPSEIHTLTQRVVWSPCSVALLQRPADGDLTCADLAQLGARPATRGAAPQAALGGLRRTAAAPPRLRCRHPVRPRMACLWRLCARLTGAADADRRECPETCAFCAIAAGRVVDGRRATLLHQVQTCDAAVSDRAAARWRVSVLWAEAAARTRAVGADAATTAHAGCARLCLCGPRAGGGRAHLGVPARPHCFCSSPAR